MSPTLSANTRVVLLDIEGTTTPIAFVHETLFGFARSRIGAYLAAEWQAPEVRRIVEMLAEERRRETEAAPPVDAHDASTAGAYLTWLMDRDRKSPALKELQGLIWDAGYHAGELRGLVWDDVPRAMARWTSGGLRLAIYSSGSEVAQRRLFGSTAHGDLTRHIEAFFDTRVGGKLLPESYVHIAERMGVQPREICFVSDVVGELRAAAAAGCDTVLSLRPGNPVQADAGDFSALRSFDEL